MESIPLSKPHQLERITGSIEMAQDEGPAVNAHGEDNGTKHNSLISVPKSSYELADGIVRNSIEPFFGTQ